ncbi:MAG: hypothetical protein AAGD96_34590 [Chloroflexota bacterium]
MKNRKNASETISCLIFIVLAIFGLTLIAAFVFPDFGGVDYFWGQALGISAIFIVFLCFVLIIVGAVENFLRKRRLKMAKSRSKRSNRWKRPFIWKRIRQSIDEQMTQLEIEELEEVELQIWAAERNLEFREEDSLLSKKIFSLFSSINLMQNDFSHFIVVDELVGRFIIFRHESRLLKAVTKQNHRLSKTQLTGVCVEFKDQTVPTFTLVDKSVADKVEFKESRKEAAKREQLKANKFPDWLSHREFQCYCHPKDAETVADFLEGSGPFRMITHGTPVRLIGFRDDMVCAFFQVELNSDGSNFYRFERFAMRILELWGGDQQIDEKKPKN